jgi:hypothetical protein
MNRFVVALDSGNREQRNALTALFQTKAWSVWHHFEDLWLLSGVPEAVTPKSLYHELAKIAVIGKHPVLILRVVDGDHDYYGKTRAEGWEWMEKSWGKASI